MLFNDYYSPKVIEKQEAKLSLG